MGFTLALFFMSKLQYLNTILLRGHGDKRNHLPAVKRAARALGFGASKSPFKIIHIAGTNGKGTTAALLAGALHEAGHKTGLFISPHVYNITERVQVNGREISPKKLDFYVGQVLAKETKKLNFFEVLTLAAFLYFRAQKVDFAIIECGIGGRMDSTNIFTPALSIITSVDIDHADILGNTLAKIAAQKAGIIKRGVPCICGPLAKSAKAVIKKEASAKDAPLKILPRAQNAFLQNAAIALESAKIFGVKKIPVKNFKMPARFEVKKTGGKIIIKDGAHNPAALKEFIKIYQKSPYKNPENTLIYAASADKDYKKAAKILAPHFKNIILTSVGGVPPQELQKYFKNAAAVPLKNLTIQNLKKLPGNIIVLGSFYLASRIA